MTNYPTSELKAENLRLAIAAIERSRDEQPQRLAQARTDADAARKAALAAEPWDELWSALPCTNLDGELTGMLGLPNITAKELFGSRLAYDILDCGVDHDRIDDVQSRYFAMVNGDPGHMFLIAMSALSTIASLVVPQLLDTIETQGSDYDTRVLLAQARRKAWDGRVSDLHSRTDLDGS